MAKRRLWDRPAALSGVVFVVVAVVGIVVAT